MNISLKTRYFLFSHPPERNRFAEDFLIDTMKMY